MSKTKRGSAIASSSGIMIGVAQKLDHTHQYIQEYKINPAEATGEYVRFQQAVVQAEDAVQLEVEQLAEHPQRNDLVSILQAHGAMLDDPELSRQVEQLIQEKSINAEWALKKALNHIGKRFDCIQDAYLRSKKEDIYHVGQRIFTCLSGSEPPQLTRQSIMVAVDFSPSDIVSMWRAGVAGFIAVQGSEYSHAMIVARGVGLPGLIGVHGLFEYVEDGDQLILDAEQGLWVLEPEESERSVYALAQERLADDEQKLVCPGSEEKVEHTLSLMANLEFFEEVELAHKYRVEGVGLFRTEFLFMQAEMLPNEDEQYHYYAQVVQGMLGKPVTFRLLDVGADKLGSAEAFLGVHLSDNPALGLRGVRMLLHKPEILEAQLRAIVRVSAWADVSILVPMVTIVAEMVAVRARLEAVKRDLGVDSTIPLGCMIEVPAAVFVADELAKVSDFFSIGSNDLVQYSLAVDRADEYVSYLYDENHPMILKLIQMTVDAAHAHDIPVAVCGELAANPHWSKTFLDMRMTSLSMNARYVLAVRKQLQALS